MSRIAFASCPCQSPATGVSKLTGTVLVSAVLAGSAGAGMWWANCGAAKGRRRRRLQHDRRRPTGVRRFFGGDQRRPLGTTGGLAAGGLKGCLRSGVWLFRLATIGHRRAELRQYQWPEAAIGRQQVGRQLVACRRVDGPGLLQFRHDLLDRLGVSLFGGFAAAAAAGPGRGRLGSPPRWRGEPAHTKPAKSKTILMEARTAMRQQSPEGFPRKRGRIVSEAAIRQWEFAGWNCERRGARGGMGGMGC